MNPRFTSRRFPSPRTFLAGILLAASLFPSRLAAAEDGGLISPFELGLSARSLGMGGAVGALSDDAAAALDNPAVLSTFQRQEIATLHAPLFVDTSYDAVAYVRPVGTGAFLGAGSRLATTGVPLTTDSISIQSTFSVQQWQGVLAYGFNAWKGLGLGTSVKYLRQSFPPESDSGFGLDLGLLYRFPARADQRSRLSYRNLALGFSVAELVQSEFRLNADTSRFARTFKPALSYRFMSRGGKTSLWLGAEGQSAKGIMHMRTGVELGLIRVAFLRGGYDGDAPSFGLGIRYLGFALDWALANRDLGSSHRFSLSYRFGVIRDPRAAQKLNALKMIARTYGDMERYPEALQSWEKLLQEFPEDNEAPGAKNDLEKKRRRAVDESLRIAREALARNDLLQAVPALNRALGMDPHNAEVQALMKKVDEKTFLSQSYLVGLEAFNQEDYKSALVAFESIYRRDPGYRDVARLWSDTKSRFAPLEAMSEEVSRLYGKGVGEFLKGRYGKAIEIWRRVLEKDPKNFLIQRNIAEAQARMKEVSGAPPPDGGAK